MTSAPRSVRSGMRSLHDYRHRHVAEEVIERLDKDTTFYVTEDVLEEYRRRVRVGQQGRQQST